MKSPPFDPGAPSSSGLWLRGLTGPLAAGVVLAAFWISMLASLQDKSLTYDEPVHAAAGYTYWKFNDYRLNPENGNLPQRVAALPLVLSDYRFPPFNTDAWQMSNEWSLGNQWFHKMGNSVEGMLLRGRAANGLLAVALGALVWWWARQLFGPWGGLLSLLLYVLNPTILANGALMTSDTACSLFFLASTWSFWRMLHRLSISRLLLSALIMGGLFVSKMSALLIVPVALTLIAARLFDGRPLPVALRGAGRELTGRSRQALAFAAAAVVHTVIVGTVIWGFYGFRYEARAHPRPGLDQNAYTWEHLLDKPSPDVQLGQLNLNPAQQARVREIFEARHVQLDRWLHEALGAMQIIRQTVLTPAQVQKLDELVSAPPAALVPRLLEFVNRHQLLPEAYVYGCAYAWRGSQSRTAFLNGRVGAYGWKSFFPYTFLVKTPLPVFGVIGLALAAAVARGPAGPEREGGVRGWRPGGRRFYETLPLWTLLAFFWAALIPSHLNIGHRHLMPTYAPLFVLCGMAARWLDGWPAFGAGERGFAAIISCAAGVALAGLLAALAAEVLYRFPNYLAYFNGIVSPAQGYRHLVDSSLDWGQDLPGVRRYLEQHPPDGPVYLSYFGNASPDYYQIPAKDLRSFPGWDRQESPPLRMLELPSGMVDPGLADLLRRQPDYDLVSITRDDRNAATGLLLKKPAALRLTGGTYLISASMLQPIYGRGESWGPWNERYETAYQGFYHAVEPLLSDNQADRLAALKQHSFAEWQGKLAGFDQFRFARLTAYLRQREPDDNVNFSILIYRLSDEDLVRALEGPPPELDPVAEMRRYEEAVQFEPGSAEAHSELGAALFRKGRVPEAIGQYEEALRLDPGSAEIHCNLGLVLSQAGRVGEAIAHYEEALRITPDDAGMEYNLGNTLFRVGRLPEAADHYEAALRLNPGFADAQANLGEALFRLGKLEEAIAHFEEALRLNPADDGARRNLELARRQLAAPEASSTP